MLRYAIGIFLWLCICLAACGVMLYTVEPVEFILAIIAGDAWFLVTEPLLP